jgi:RNA polymerase sigma-70 factor, ECF subfamily
MEHQTARLPQTTEDVWGQLHAKLRRYVSRRVRNRADVDDVLQRVFLQVHRALPSLHDHHRIRAWVYRTTRNAIVDYYRAPTHHREVASGGVLDLADETADRDDAGREPSALHELAGCVTVLFDGLSAGDQEALRWVELQGMTQVEAAQRAGVSVSGMKSRLQRARHRLKRLIEDCCRIERDRRGGIIAFESRRRRASCIEGKCLATAPCHATAACLPR